jgi:N-acetylneuraminate synthase/N,N'-diacetyllegionaminate synthase
VNRTLVIAEIGSCHDGEPLQAIRLINVARSCGADVAKFQFWSSADRLAERRHADAYREIYRRYQLPQASLALLKARCDNQGLEFMCTTYLPEDVEVVAPFVSRFKVASFEAADVALMDAHRSFDDREIIVSTGMIGDGEYWALRDEWSDVSSDVSWLHCVSSYPAPVESLNLSVIIGYGMDGFSDHSSPIETWTGALAVAAGARIIEAHLRLDDTDPQNPDAPHAMTPSQFSEYVRNIRFAETALGHGNKCVMACEAAMTPYRV